MVRTSVSSLLLVALAPLVVERSHAVPRRGLVAESLPDGLQHCPNHPTNGTGYSSWADLQLALDKNKDDDSHRHPYYLCPGMVYNAIGVTLMISHYFTTIQCADSSAVCVVEQATIVIKEDLVGIRFEGIDFVKPAGAIVVGKGSHVYFIDSSIQGAVFNEIEELQAPIVSYGHLFVIGSRFINNVAHGAIWARDDTLYVDRTKFERNHAVSFLSSAAAIHIGSTDPKALVASSITNSCFMDNEGYHIVYVQGKRASVSWTTGNAVDGEAECPGITTAMTDTGGYCRPFEVLGTSTCEAILRDPKSPVAAPTPVNGNETDPALESIEADGGENALAEAAGKVTFNSGASPLYSLSCGTIVVTSVFIALLATFPPVP